MEVMSGGQISSQPQNNPPVLPTIQKLLNSLTPDKRLQISLSVLRTILSSMIKEKQRFRERFRDPDSPDKEVPIRYNINVQTLQEFECNLYAYNPEASNFKILTSEHNPHFIPKGHAQYRLITQNKKAMARWSNLLDQNNCLSPKQLRNWLSHSLIASLQFLRTYYSWMRDVQLFDTSNSQIILRVGSSVFENEKIQKIMQVSRDGNENLSGGEEDAGNFSLNSEIEESENSNIDNNAVCYLRVNVSLPLHWPDYSNDRLPPAAQSDVKNSQLFWLLQSSGPIMYGKIGSVTDNFWRIRTFAACQSNIAQGKLSLNPKIADGIKSSLDKLSKYLLNFENMLPSQLALSTILWQIHNYGENEEYWVEGSEEIRFKNILEFLRENFKNGKVQDFFLPEMNLLSLVPDMTIMYILGKIDEELEGGQKILNENQENVVDLPKTRDNARNSRFSSSDVPESTISAPTVSTMMQPTGGLSRAQRKTSSLSGMLGTASHDRRNRIVDLEKDIKNPEKMNKISDKHQQPIPKPRSRTNIAKASRDSGLSDESCVFEKSELKLHASRVEILSGSHGIMVGLKKVDLDNRSDVSSSGSRKTPPIAPVRHESKTQNISKISSSVGSEKAAGWVLNKTTQNASSKTAGLPVPIATSTLNRDYRRVSQVQNNNNFNTLQNTRNSNNINRSSTVEWEMNI